jgi:hypothetical protein
MEERRREPLSLAGEAQGFRKEFQKAICSGSLI